ncbi:hypothetical protein [Parafilimonas sp.]|uniref:baeRF3 domain-containing protein n=1 Tax=Parafilimonas sp. TaxID=1969739 RepID=UPI0039E2E624
MPAEKYRAEALLLTAAKCQPCISVIMPFEPKMHSRAAIEQSLKITVDKIKQELHKNFSKETADKMLGKLQQVTGQLDFNTHKKSVAIYVSPLMEKLYYLDIEVREKILTDTSFEIREIIRNKKYTHEFLLLVISTGNEKIYAGNENKLQLIIANNAMQAQRGLRGPVAGFAEASAIKETAQKKFLHYVNSTLLHILKIHPLPLFVMAPQKTMGYLQNISYHQINFSGFVHGNFDDATESELLKALGPQLKNLSTVKEKHLMKRLKAAHHDRRLVTGIHDVWLRAGRRHKQLLVVEKDFYCAAFVTEKGETIFSNIDTENKVIAKDAVDNIIEMVLENGGDVEFADDLKAYNRIALIEANNDQMI